MKHVYSLFAFLFLFSSQIPLKAQSIAREWNEELLHSISADFARPTVHARNLFHSSIVMYDAWAAYSPDHQTYLIGQDLHGFQSPFLGVPEPDDVEAARREAISFAMYRLIEHRYSSSPGVQTITDAINMRMSNLGYDHTNVSTDYVNGGPAELGNYIAEQMIAYGFQDGANEENDYQNEYYEPFNVPIEVEMPGNPYILDPNRWQPISLSLSIDQSGEVVASTPPFLSPEWGNVQSFSMTSDDYEDLERDGHTYRVYKNPGEPALFDWQSTDGLDDPYRWNFTLVAVWQSHLTTEDGVLWDASPNSVGNIQDYPDTQEEYFEFYNLLEGGDPGEGYDVNPVTGLPYEPQMVARGDYARILAEFWADGPNSVTPPGHWFEIYNEAVADHELFERRWMGTGPLLDDLEYDVKAYFSIGGAMHDAAIAAWSIKGYYDYLRPVSAIRFMAEQGQCSDPDALSYSPAGMPLIPGYVEVVEVGDELAGEFNQHVGKIKLYTWRGPDYIEDPETDVAGVGWILAENWWPYQRPSFVSPPFAGYISGHSTYSRTAAELLSLMTGSEYFPGGMSGFEAQANDFLVFENGPSQTFELQWAKYIDASDQCSLSRIWGGIHPPIDDIPGRKIGMELGPQAMSMANSIVAVPKPYVTSVDFSQTAVSVSDIGDTFTASIEFDQPMLASSSPTLSFVGLDLSNVLTIDQAEWTSETTYTITYSVENFELEALNNGIHIIGASSADGHDQKPFLQLDAISIDTKAPVSALGNLVYTTINDDAMDDVFYFINFQFNELCNTSIVPSVSLTADIDPSGALAFSSAFSAWTNDSTFIATFVLADTDEAIPGIDISIEGAFDLIGNEMPAQVFGDQLSVDTKNPTATISISDNHLNTQDIGANALSFTIEFDDPVDTTSDLIVEFIDEPTIGNALLLNSLTSEWISETECLISYDLLSDPSEHFDVSIGIDHIVDTAGNALTNAVFENVVTIDTKKPLIATYSLLNDLVSDQNVGSSGQVITFEFDEPMSTDLTPLVSVTNSELMSSLSYNIINSEWTDETHFDAHFTVTDQNTTADLLGFSIDFGFDEAGNAMDGAEFESAIMFDTENPSIISITSNSYNITSPMAGGLELTAIYDEPMSDATLPVIDFAPELAQNFFQLNSDESGWLSPYTSVNNYDVPAQEILAGDVSISVSTATDLAGNQLIIHDEDAFFALNIEILSTYESFDQAKVVAYPSPVRSGESLFLSFGQKTTGIVQIRITDVQGKITYEEQINVGTNSTTEISTSGLSSGLYIINVTADDLQAVGKVIVD